MRMAGLRDLPHLAFNIVFVSVFEFSDIEHIVDLMGTLSDRVLCLKNLALDGHLSQRKSHCGADVDRTVTQIFFAAFNLGPIDRYGLKSVFLGLITEFFEGSVL